MSAVAGMDLALATGRGDPLMTAWPGVPAPLVPDAQVVQIGEREGRSPVSSGRTSTTPPSTASTCSRRARSAPTPSRQAH